MRAPARRRSRSRTSSVAARVASTVERMPPPARAMDSYVAPSSRISNSPARCPPYTRWVWQSTRPGVTHRPPRSCSSRTPVRRSAGSDAMRSHPADRPALGDDRAVGDAGPRAVPSIVHHARIAPERRSSRAPPGERDVDAPARAVAPRRSPDVRARPSTRARTREGWSTPCRPRGARAPARRRSSRSSRRSPRDRPAASSRWPWPPRAAPSG